jgi:energy-coupling factor transporter transmembrane protein EcfT
MVGWLLIAIGVLVLLVVLIKIKEIRHHFVYRLIGILLIFVLATFVYIWIKSGINITTYEGFLQIGRAYYSWAASLFGNVGGITGYAVQQDWGLNSTIQSLS